MIEKKEGNRMEQWWKKPYIKRRDWVLDSLEELSLTSEEAMLILLIDYLNEHNVLINHSVLANKLKKERNEIDDLLSKLTAKGYLEILYNHRKIEFSIDGLFSKDEQKPMQFDESLFHQFEEEFARPLSQVELKRLSDWMHTYNQKLIYYALRQAVIYDKHSFDYIEKILIEWKRKGVSAENIEEGVY